MAWPTKTDFVDGDVLTAAQVNNIGTNLNIFNPTSATNGQVWVANGSGSGAYGIPDVSSMAVINSGNMPNATLTISNIPQTYNQLVLYFNNIRVTTNGVTPYIRYNNNSGTNYTTYRLMAYPSTLLTSVQNTDGFYFFDNIGSGYDMQAWFVINNYTQVANHSIFGQHVFRNQSATIGSTFIQGTYSIETAAITRIDVLSMNSSSGTYALYGVK